MHCLLDVWVVRGQALHVSLQEGAGAAQLDGAGDQDGDAAVAPPPPPEPRVSPVAMVWTFVATFFTSLIPEQPPPVNAN